MFPPSTFHNHLKIETHLNWRRTSNSITPCRGKWDCDLQDLGFELTKETVVQLMLSIGWRHMHTVRWPDMFECTHCCWVDNSSKEGTPVPVAELNASPSLRVLHEAMVLWIWCCRSLSFLILGEKSPQIRTDVTDMKSSKSLLNQWIFVIPSSNNYIGRMQYLQMHISVCTHMIVFHIILHHSNKF